MKTKNLKIVSEAYLSHLLLQSLKISIHSMQKIVLKINSDMFK